MLPCLCFQIQKISSSVFLYVVTKHGTHIGICAMEYNNRSNYLIAIVRLQKSWNIAFFVVVFVGCFCPFFNRHGHLNTNFDIWVKYLLLKVFSLYSIQCLNSNNAKMLYLCLLCTGAAGLLVSAAPSKFAKAEKWEGEAESNFS